MKNKINLFDYHTQALNHGIGKELKIKETVEAAIDKGLIAICLTDHFPLPVDFEDPTKDIRVKYPDYMEKVLEAKEKYKDEIEVLLGAEFDWVEGYEEWIIDEIAKYPFDYVIGSIHFLSGKLKNGKRRNFCIDYTKKEAKAAQVYFGDIKSLVEKYYQEIIGCVKSNLFDGVGHLDRIKVFNNGSLFSENEQWYRELVKHSLDVIKSCGQVIEMNTSGWRHDCNSLYPSYWILEEMKKRNIDITIGSDAHVPSAVGRDLDKGVKLAKIAGYRSLVRFKKRKIIKININSLMV